MAGCSRRSPQRLPGRVDAEGTTFASSTGLAAALLRAAAAHGAHEKRTGQHDADWPDWYAEYLVREQDGEAVAVISGGVTIDGLTWGWADVERSSLIIQNCLLARTG